jgi:penicillin-binding protein 1C
VLLALIAAAAVASWIALGRTREPMLVNRSGFSRAVYDRNGQLLRLTLSSDEKLRLWVPLDEIPSAMIDATLMREDSHFRWHPGVNPISLIRAAWMTYVLGGRRIGGSTITMQLARQRFGIDSRSLGGKLEQIAVAIELERHYTKDEILEAYLNTVPYGGNVEGVGAASLVYFGKEPRHLSVPEAITLAVIPQSPRLRSPSSNAGRAALTQARSGLLQKWERTHADSLDADFNHSAQIVSRTPHQLPFQAPHLVNEMLARDDRSARITLTLDLDLQKLVEREFRANVERSSGLGIRNGAAILVDYRTMEVRAYVGSADYFNDAIEGQVNGLGGRRSPGSALKPFIYALAIDEGLIHPASMLKDTELRIAAYNPENFDREFLGPIDATSALVRSRNVPAIELEQMLRPPGFYGFLKSAGVRDLRDENFYGLALALGGVELSMEEMAQLYAMIANGGELRTLINTTGSHPQSGVRLLSPEASYAVIGMLRQNPRPTNDFTLSQVPSHDPIPWKTGTSYGFRDAWAMGIVGPYVLGVWIGNADGEPNPNFIGRDAAGPLFFNIADALRAREPLIEQISSAGLNLKRVKVCAISGQLPGPYCDHFKETWFIPGKSPIATCTIHRGVPIDLRTGLRACPGQTTSVAVKRFEFWPSDLTKLFRSAGLERRQPPPLDPDCNSGGSQGLAPTISSPTGGVVYSADATTEIPFIAVSDADSRIVFWFVDSDLIGSSRPGEPLFWHAKPGNFVVRVVDEQGRAAAEEIRVVPTIH